MTKIAKNFIYMFCICIKILKKGFVMDRINGYSPSFTSGTIKVKRSVKRYAPKDVVVAIRETAENIAEIADRNGVNITYSMRVNPKQTKKAKGRSLYVRIDRSNGLFTRLLSGKLRGYGEYRNPMVKGNFDRAAFVDNVREIVLRFKTQSYRDVTGQVKKKLV